jgi:hypothetical protein
MVPQGYAAAMVGTPPTSGSSSSETDNQQAGSSASNTVPQSPTSQVQMNQYAKAYAQMFSASRQYSQFPMFGYIPVAGYAPPRRTKDTQESGVASELDNQTEQAPRTSTPPSLLQMQQKQLQQYIEVLYPIHCF